MPAPDTERVETKPGTRTRINLVLFSGGSGTESITTALLKHPQISLKILINAYDDGHSTGRLRRFVPGMLGPSDVRKNIARLMPSVERCHKALKAISDHRLPVGISRDDALGVIDTCKRGEIRGTVPQLADHFDALTVGQTRRLFSYFETFLAYLRQQEPAGRTFDFTDCALGNIFFAGCYLQEGRDFNRAIRAFSTFYEVSPDVLLNITAGENLFLVAEKENGSVLLSEAELVAAQDSTPISELFLLDEETYWTRVEHAMDHPPEQLRKLFREKHVTPAINPEAARALAEADVIVYGPGTQHSSLFPSYLTDGVAEAIIVNTQADKIFIGNIYRDFDSQEDDANDIASKLLSSLSRGGRVTVNWLDVVSHFFVQRSDTEVSKAKYVPFDEKRFAFPLETVKARDWEAVEGRHSGGYVVDELHQIVQAKIDLELPRLHHMVSIVIPVLNEERTIEQVLRSVVALDFQAFGLTKEIIVADGGSTDRSAEIARSVTSVRVFQLEKPLGRGAALRLGIDRARGNIIVFFPGDNEYRPDDLITVVGSLVQSNFNVVFGSRAVKCTNLTERLHQIYGDNRLLYLTSKYGGILLSILTLLLYNRYVSDVLSSIKAFDARLLRSLALKSNGIDLETEIVAKLSLKREYMLELPVEYQPRTRSAGKKITAADGLKAIVALFRYRVSAT
ncbi:MAG: 2-phospho-L-lactate transferase CofD family protein [Acidobacteriota bacterium]|nr:2-phospho-L-lactate transferase CofD family protein [Acidobacteriota bacterium]